MTKTLSRTLKATVAAVTPKAKSPASKPTATAKAKSRPTAAAKARPKPTAAAKAKPTNTPKAKASASNGKPSAREAQMPALAVVRNSVACPHCRKRFDASVDMGQPPRLQGAKCPNCKLFVPARVVIAAGAAAVEAPAPAPATAPAVATAAKARPARR